MWLPELLQCEPWGDRQSLGISWWIQLWQELRLYMENRGTRWSTCTTCC